MDERVREPAEVAAYVERVAAEMTEMGMQRMASRVFACLLVDDEGALTSAELGEQLRVSPAAVSGAVRYLAQIGLISREREPGSRRERYRVVSDRWAQSFTQREHMLRNWEATLTSGLDMLGRDTSAGRRIAETAEFFAFMRTEMAAIEKRWREHLAERDRERDRQQGRERDRQP